MQQPRPSGPSRSARYSPFSPSARAGPTNTKGEIMDSETLFLERARTLLPQVLPFVKWAYLHAAPSLPTSAVELIECLEKLGMNQGAESMRSDFTDYFADQVHRLSDKFPDGGMGPELAEFCFQANKRFGPFSEDVEAIGDFDIVRGRMIEQLEGLRNTFRKPSPTNDGRTPSPPPAPNVEQAVVNGGANSTDGTPPPRKRKRKAKPKAIQKQKEPKSRDRWERQSQRT